MRKSTHIKAAAKEAPEEKISQLILDVLLDIRELLKKQNEMMRKNNYGTKK